jgi:hypothetical protein
VGPKLAIRCGIGSPGCNIGRTFRAEFRWHGSHRQLRKAKGKRFCRNPVALAREWRKAIDDSLYSSQADLARDKGISRARVTQILNLLKLSPAVVEVIVSLGDPMHAPTITERQLRQLKNLPEVQQCSLVGDILAIP